MTAKEGILTDEQFAVVHHAGGHAYVLAAPGSGKTHTLVQRIAYLVENGVAHPAEAERASKEPLLASARDLPDAGTEPDRLRALLHLWVTHVANHRDNLLVFTQVRHAIDRGPAWRRVRAARKDFENLLAAALERAAVPDPELRRLALLGMVNHLPQWYRPNGPLTPTQIADGWTDAILAR